MDTSGWIDPGDGGSRGKRSCRSIDATSDVVRFPASEAGNVPSVRCRLNPIRIHLQATPGDWAEHPQPIGRTSHRAGLPIGIAIRFDSNNTPSLVCDNHRARSHRSEWDHRRPNQRERSDYQSGPDHHLMSGRVQVHQLPLRVNLHRDLPGGATAMGCTERKLRREMASSADNVQPVVLLDFLATTV